LNSQELQGLWLFLERNLIMVRFERHRPVHDMYFYAAFGSMSEFLYVRDRSRRVAEPKMQFQPAGGEFSGIRNDSK